MKCTHIKRLLPLFAGGDLPVQQADSVRAHLFVCQQCNDLASGFSESSVWLNSEARIDLDDRFFDELRDSVWRSLRAEQTERRPAGIRYSWLSLLAATAAIAVLAAMPLLRSRVVTPSAKVEVAVETKARDHDSGLIPSVSPGKGSGHWQGSHRRGVSRRVAKVAPVVKVESRRNSESIHTVREEVTPNTNFIRRIEIQTADPTIRIIWLVQDPAAPVATNIETED